MSAMAPLSRIWSGLSLNPSPQLSRFQEEQAERDRDILSDLAKRLYLASALERLRKR
jgi:hypothetical protein